jgi:sodium transport system permease protein
LPAIAEEVTFRGVVLAGLRRSGSRWIAVVGSALVFGLFHVNPYHVRCPRSVWLLLGWVALESGSILPGVLIHLVNNGAQVLLDRIPGLAERSARRGRWSLALASTAVGAFLVRAVVGRRRGRPARPRCRCAPPRR